MMYHFRIFQNAEIVFPFYIIPFPFSQFFCCSYAIRQKQCASFFALTSLIASRRTVLVFNQKPSYCILNTMPVLKKIYISLILRIQENIMKPNLSHSTLIFHMAIDQV